MNMWRAFSPRSKLILRVVVLPVKDSISIESLIYAKLICAFRPNISAEEPAEIS